MTADLYFVSGLLLAIASLPFALSGILNREIPLVSGLGLVLGLCLLLYGITLYEDGFDWRETPEAVIRAVGYWLNR